mmetsp:Transcript_38686/g.111799  ORF Transcript_38686/g.111799 Transcript_38686/m.111799 type:complete len:414 (+) Transcript_38686:921-2162(+)
MLVQHQAHLMGCHLLHGLPRHFFVFAISPVEAPLECDFVHRPSGNLVRPTVDQPSLALAIAVGTFNTSSPRCAQAIRVKFLARVFVNRETELLAARLSEDDRDGVGASSDGVHEHQIRKAIPCAHDVHLVVLMGSRAAIVENALEEHVSFFQPFGSGQFGARPCSPQTTSPQITARIGATETKGRHAGEAGVGPMIAHFGLEKNGIAIGVHVRVEESEMHIRWRRRGRQHENAFDHTRHPSRGLQVADVGLRARVQKGHRARFHDRPQGADLYRVTQRCAGAVTFGNGNVRGCELRLVHGCPDASLLGRAIRRSHARGSPILVHGAPCEAREHALGIVLRFAVRQHEPATTFTACIAVGRGIICEATPARRQHPRSAVQDEITRVEEEAATQRQCGVALGVDDALPPIRGRAA